MALDLRKDLPLEGMEEAPFCTAQSSTAARRQESDPVWLLLLLLSRFSHVHLCATP